MPGGNQITFGVGFNVNESGLNKLKQSLQEIQRMGSQDLLKTGNFRAETVNKELKQIKAMASEVEQALNKAFNSNLGTLNVSRFNAELKNVNLSAFASKLDAMGASGRAAFNNLAVQALQFNTNIKQSYTLLDKMGQTLANTVKWRVATAAVNAFTSSIQSAFNYVRVLDSSLTDIRIVTGQSRDQMAEFAVQANEAAQALGRQTKEYTNAALAYYQQGLNAQEVQQRTETTLKAQNVTGAGTEMTDYLTAVWNGYKVVNDEIELYIDKLAAVADSSASNMAELATGMSKVAATANNMGVDMDQLTAQLATIIATTRQAPETVGNALKTIYARINDIKAGTDEAEVSLGNYTKKMASLGFNVLDSNNELRATGEVMEEIGERWQTLTREQQVYLAQTMAGQRQMNNLIALFDSWEQYSEMLNVSLNAQGTLNEKNSRYMESLSAHINQFKAAVEGMQDAFVDEDHLKAVYDIGTNLVNVFTQFIHGIGGASGALAGLGMVASMALQKQMTDGIVTFINNLRITKQEADETAAHLELLHRFSDLGRGIDSSGQVISGISPELQSQITLLTERVQLAIRFRDVMSQEEQTTVNSLLSEEKELFNQIDALKERIQVAQQYYNNQRRPEDQLKTSDLYSWNASNNQLIINDNQQAQLQKMGEALQNLRAQAADTITELNKMQNVFRGAGRPVSAEVELWKQELEDVNRKIQDFQYKIQNKSAFTTPEIFAGWQQGLAQAQNQAAELTNRITKANGVLSETNSLFMAIAEAARSGEYGRFSQEIERIASSDILGTSAKFNQLRSVFQQMGVDLDNVIYDIEHAQQSLNGLNTQANTITTTWQRLIQVFRDKQFAASVGQLVQGISQLAMAANTIRGFVSTIKQVEEGTISAGDAILRITASLGILFTTAKAGFKSLTAGLSGVTAKIITAQVAQEGLTLAEVAQQVAVEQGLRSWGADIEIKLSDALAAKVAAGENLTLAESVAFLTAQLQAFIIANSGLLLGIGAAIGIVYGLSQAMHKEEKALEKAQKKAEEAKNKYNELKDAYEELKDSFKDYEEAQNAIDQLTIGTQEWRDALFDANQQVLELLSSYPELAKYLKTDTNGRLTLDQEGRDAYFQNAQNDMRLAQRDSLITSMGVNTQTGRLTAEEFTNAHRSQTGGTFGTKNVIEVVDLWQTLTDQAKQALTQAIARNDQAALSELIDQYFGGLQKTSKGAAQLIMSQGADFLAMAEKGANANTALMQQIAAITNETADNNQAYLDSQYKTIIDTITASFLEGTDLKPEDFESVTANLNTFVENVNRVMKESGLTEQEGRAVFSFTGGGKNADITALNKTQIENLGQYLEKYAETLNSDSDTLLEALAEADKNWQLQVDKVAANLVRSVQTVFSQLANQGSFSAEQAESVGNMLTKAYAEGGDQGLKALEDIIASVGSDKLPELFSVFNNITDNMSLGDLQDALSEADIASVGFIEQLRIILGLFQEAAGFDILAAKYKDAKDVSEDLHYGDSISSDDYQKLLKFNKSLADFFEITSTREYKLKTSGEALNKAIDNFDTDKLVEGLAEANKKIAELQGLSEDSLHRGEDLRWTDREALTEQADYIAALGGAGKVSEDQARAYATQLRSETGWSLTSQQIKDLHEAAEVAGSLDDALKGVNEEIDKYNSALDSIDNKLDADVSTEELERRAKYLAEYGDELLGISDDLQNNHEAAALIAEDFLRAEKAAERVADKLDDWKDILKPINRGTGDYIDALEEVDNTYKDLLNLSNDAHLSEEFLTSAENMELLNKAIQGGEEGIEAYAELADAAQRDLVKQGLKIQPEFEVDPAALDAATNDIMSMINDIESSIDDIEIGTDLTGDEELMAQLNEIVNAAGLTADQATALLASMGIDAQVVERPAEDNSYQSGFTYYDPAQYEIQDVGQVADGAGGSFPAQQLVRTKDGELKHESGSANATTPPAFALEVTNAKKGVGSGGNINKTKVGGLGGGGGRKGGGGGGKNKQPKQKTTKKFKSKIDPYHDVNIKIGDVKEGLDKLEKQRDKLIGKDAVDNLTKQINLLEKEKELLQEKAKIAQGELQKQAQELAQQGAIIDNQGNILNYNQLLKDKQDQINKAIEVANGLTDEQQEAYLKYVDQLKDEYKELEEGIKNLDDTKQLLDDLGADYQDLIDKQIELAIEAFDLKINVELDLQDAEKDFNEFRKKVIDKVKDDEHGRLAEVAARNYSQYYNNNGGLVPELTNHINQIQKEIEVIRNGGFSQIYGDNLSAAADDLKKYNDELMNALEEAQEVIDETHDHFLDAIDAMNDAFDTQQDNLDKIDDLLQHDMDILQLIHGEENYDEMQNLWNQQVAQDNARLQALQKEQQYWRDRVDQYTEGTDEWKKAMENWQDAFEKTNDAMMTSVQNLQARWENSINSIMSTLRNQTYGGNMAAALEDWDKILWHDDRYLDPLERATGLMDLQSKYRDAIRGTNDPKLQQKLADLEEKQLNALAEKEHLREIDLRISEQQLAVMQAQMALEDAQQAKTKLRLRRDSQGNYTYQYVADEENIEEKTQEYAKALADYRELVKESLHDDLQDLSDYTQEFYDKMQEAQMAYGDDTQALMEEQERLYEMYMGEDGYITNLARDANLSMQDLQEATFIQATGLNEMLRDDLFDKFLGPNAEMKEALNNLLAAGGEVPTLIDAFLNDTALRAFDDIDQKSKEVLFNDNEGLFPEWQSALVDLATNYQTEFVPRVIDAMNYLQQANQSYVDGLAIMQGAANRTTENIALGLAYDTFYTNSLNDATNALLQTQDAELQSAEKVYNALKKNEEAFKDQTLAATDAANAMFLYWLALNGGVASNVPYSVEGLSNVNIQMPRITPAAPAYSGGDYSGGGDYGGSDTGTTSAPSNSSSGGGLHGSVPVVGGRIDPYTGQRLATGGYTGEWNSEPRLAWLDQKELVLNADDTKNMLDAVQIVRTIADKVSAATTAAAASIGGSGLADLVSAAGESILQNVVINADFPAVQDATQIKQAFNELVNLASQRASGNRRTY